MSVPDRVAVVAVHGIADQRAGQTVRELARLLCHGATGEPRYVQGEIHEVLVPVARLEPGGTVSPTATRDAGDTARERPGTPSGFYQAQRSASVEREDSSWLTFARHNEQVVLEPLKNLVNELASAVDRANRLRRIVQELFAACLHRDLIAP